MKTRIPFNREERLNIGIALTSAVIGAIVGGLISTYQLRSGQDFVVEQAKLRLQERRVEQRMAARADVQRALSELRSLRHGYATHVFYMTVNDARIELGENAEQEDPDFALEQQVGTLEAFWSAKADLEASVQAAMLLFGPEARSHLDTLALFMDSNEQITIPGPAEIFSLLAAAKTSGTPEETALHRATETFLAAVESDQLREIGLQSIVAMTKELAADFEMPTGVTTPDGRRW